jgi:hypothetical protein
MPSIVSEWLPTREAESSSTLQLASDVFEALLWRAVDDLDLEVADDESDVRDPTSSGPLGRKLYEWQREVGAGDKSPRTDSIRRRDHRYSGAASDVKDRCSRCELGVFEQ